MFRLDQAQDFMWRYARLLERQLFAWEFAGGAAEPVLAALRAYQNPDGGFGNALEPDKRVPASQPIDVEIALHVLDAVDGFADPMVARVCDFLASITTPEGGIPFALPSVRDFPRAMWWDAPDDPPASLNPTAAIVGLLLKHGVAHPWVEQASAFCWRAIEGSETNQFHDLMPILAFLAHAPDRARAERALAAIVARVGEPGVVELDPEAEGYVKKPLDWAPTPQSPLRALFSDETLAAHLAALAARQQPDGGWPLSWTPISPAVEFEARGLVTLEALRTLRAYGVLEEGEERGERREERGEIGD